MELRGPSACKLPARYADAVRPPSSATASEPDNLNQQSVSATASSEAPRSSRRSGSPISALPPAGYIPPAGRGKTSSAIGSSSTNKKLASTLSVAGLAAKPAEHHKEPSGEEGHEAETDSEEHEVNVLTSPSAASRPRGRAVIPEPNQPDDIASKRVRDDRDLDFFIRRKVVRGAETNPPPRSPIPPSSSSGNDSDGVYLPESGARKAVKKSAASAKAAGPAADAKDPSSDTDIGNQGNQSVEKQHAEHRGVLDEVQEEDSEEDVIVDLTKSDSSSVQLAPSPIRPLDSKARRSSSPLKQQQLAFPKSAPSAASGKASSGSASRGASNSTLAKPPASTQPKKRSSRGVDPISEDEIDASADTHEPKKARIVRRSAENTIGAKKTSSKSGTSKNTASSKSTNGASSTKKAKGKLPAVLQAEKRQNDEDTAPEDAGESASAKVSNEPEQCLKRAIAAWTKAHQEANARQEAESKGEIYNAPSHPASPYYLHFNQPYLRKNIDPGRDDVGIGFDCRCCTEKPYVAWRRLTESSTSLLKSHVGTQRSQTNLKIAVGSKDGYPKGPLVKYLTKKIDIAIYEEEAFTKMHARHYAVGWVTEEARPLSIVHDKWFQKFLPAARRDLLPHRATVSSDIATTYHAMRDVIKERLASIDGCIHLALDIWTSAHGHSYLGVIGCWQEQGTAQRHVLDMVCLSERHTAANIAKRVCELATELGIAEKIWFITSDNASTNTAMMRLLGKDDKLPLVKGGASQIRCIAHVLNLISEAIIRPFNRAVRSKTTSVDEDEEEWASDEEVVEGSDEEDAAVEDEDDDEVSVSLHPSRSIQDESDGLIRRALKEKSVAYISDSSSGRAAIDQPLAPSAELRADSGEIGLQIRQLAWFARKLRYNTRLRDSFSETCANFQLPTPHGLLRDVATRWNSTFDMIERALVLWDAIIAWQELNAKIIPAKFRIKRAHKSSYQQLVVLLKPLSDATLKFSTRSSPTIADVMGTFEELDTTYRQIEEDDDLGLAWREAARRAGAVCMTYYGLADDTEIYYLAISLHPNLRKRFMRAVKWEPEWIEKAEDTLRRVLDERYRTTNAENESQTQNQENEDDETLTPKKKKETVINFVAQQMKLQEEEEKVGAPDPVDEWFKGNLSMVKGRPVDALAWWYDQQRIGFTHGGLTKLALDVFAAPATSVDAERLFSKAGRQVTPLRHSLKAKKLGQMVTLGAWFRENWVPTDLLAKHFREKQQAKLGEQAKKRVAASSSDPKGKKRAFDDGGDPADTSSKRQRSERLAS